MITALIALYCVHAGNIGGAVVALAIGRILGIIFSNKRED
jgi:hypothetical protein